MMKCVLSGFVAATCLAVLSGCDPEGVVIGGARKSVVIVSDDRIPSEELATEELCDYLEKATGVRAAVVRESQAPADGSGIYLGRTAFARRCVPDLDAFEDEEWTVRTVGDKLVIAGGRPRGTLYGVYHFLEDVVGIRWLSPAVEYVPPVRTLSLEGIALRGKPAMPYREIYKVTGTKADRFLARNRMNVEGARYGGGKLFGGSRGNHTMYANLGGPDEIRRLYKEHPEWFPLIDGKRYCNTERANSAAQSQLCLTNPDLRRYWTEKLRERIREDYATAVKAGVPPPLYYAIDQNDCFDGFCKCEACQKIVDREGSNGGLLLDFVNYVAEQLESEAPKSRFQMMALHSSEKPPKHLKGRRNVTIRLCDSTSNEVVSWKDTQNKKHLDNLMAWRDRAESISMWDYQVTYGVTSCKNLPTPNERTFATDIRLLRDSKGDGFFFEHEYPVAGDLRDLKVWLEFKLVENPDLDATALVREFTDLYYGKTAGAVVREYRERLGSAADAAKARVSWFPGVIQYSFITSDVLLSCLDCRARALAAVAGNVELTARVEHAFMSLDRYFLVRSQTLRRQLKGKDSAARLPDVGEVKERYRRIFDREMASRGCTAEDAGRKSDLDDFVAFVDTLRELPVPERFRDVPPDALFLIPAVCAQTWYKGMRFEDDSASPAGRVLTARMKNVLAHPHKYYPLSAYNWPLHCQVMSTMEKDRRFHLRDIPPAQPKGYHWYKLAENVKLKQDSFITLWSGFKLVLDGVVSDNSEIGQLYDIWVSVKIDGGDVYKTGKAFPELSYSFDQAAVVRKTKNAN